MIQIQCNVYSEYIFQILSDIVKSLLREDPTKSKCCNCLMLKIVKNYIYRTDEMN